MKFFTRNFKLFESPPGGFPFYFNHHWEDLLLFEWFNFTHFDLTFFLFWLKKVVKMKSIKWSILSFFFSLLNYWECLFQKVEKPKTVMPITRSYSYTQDKCPTSTLPVHNCMSSWLVKPISGFSTFRKRYIQNKAI